MSRQEDIEILRSLGLGVLVHALKHNWIGLRVLEAMDQARAQERQESIRPNGMDLKHVPEAERISVVYEAAVKQQDAGVERQRA